MSAPMAGEKCRVLKSIIFKHLSRIHIRGRVQTVVDNSSKKTFMTFCRANTISNRCTVEYTCNIARWRASTSLTGRVPTFSNVNKELSNWQVRSVCSGTSHDTSQDKRRLVLGIETSCDDTGAAVVDDQGNVLGEAIYNQTRIHVEMGGIIPPLARDLHQKHIDDVVTAALRDAKVSIQDVDAIATTVKPGMALSLSVGLEYTKQVLRQSKKPFIPIHHMEAHALTARMIHNVEFPFLVLLISGGHCLLALAHSVDDFKLLGTSLDIAPGDAIDKVARQLKLKNLAECDGMSGGQAIEVMAKLGNPRAFPLRDVMGRHYNCNFSFSGLNAHMNRLIDEEQKKYGTRVTEVVPSVSDICASFQYFILHHLAKKLQRALLFCDLKHILPGKNKTLVVSGGVASNMFLRQGLQTMCNAYDCQMVCPPPKLCTDNGIMIAWNGMEKLKADIGIEPDWEDVDFQPRCPLGENWSEEVEKCNIKVSAVKLIPGS